MIAFLIRDRSLDSVDVHVWEEGCVRWFEWCKGSREELWRKVEALGSAKILCLLRESVVTANAGVYCNVC